MSKRKIGEKFCPITAKRARDWYQKKYLSTAGYLLIIKEILRPPGVNLKIDNVSKFCAEWGISRAAFYRALSTLNVNNDGSWETSGSITLSTTSEQNCSRSEKSVSQPDSCLTNEQLSQEREKCLSTGQLSHERDAKSHERDTESHERDTESHERDTESHERDNRASKPAPSKDSERPQTIQTYTDFIKTFSDSEREEFFNSINEIQRQYLENNWQKFLNYCFSECDRLPIPPTLPECFIRKHFLEMARKFIRCAPPDVAQKITKKKRKHPYIEEMHRLEEELSRQ
ncbi:MAG: hypothetical protein QNJ38_10900 [Prochloraceae cyanobacterium]|nr:hypothetical protein [Prochloraceae cyanobacterium]